MRPCLRSPQRDSAACRKSQCGRTRPSRAGCFFPRLQRPIAACAARASVIAARPAASRGVTVLSVPGAVVGHHLPIVCEPHHKPIAVRQQIREQLVTVAPRSITWMACTAAPSRARTAVTPSRPAPLSSSDRPSAPATSFGVPGARIFRTNGTQRQQAQRRPQPVGRDGQRGMEPKSLAPWPTRSTTPRGPTRRRTPCPSCHAGRARPRRPHTAPAWPPRGARSASSNETRGLRRNRYSASTSASSAHASGNAASGDCSSTAMTRSRRALSR